MGTYTGRLWLAPHQSEKLHVQILLEEETIRITSNGTVIGDWPMSEVEIGHVGNNLHLFVEGEQLVIDPNDPELVSDLLEPTSIGENPPAQPHPPPDEIDKSPRSRKTRRGAHKASRPMKWKW